MIGRAQRHDTTGAVVHADLEQLGELAAQLGPEAVDEIRAELARRLTGALRSGDTISRVGHNEFVVAAEEISEQDAAEPGEQVGRHSRLSATINGRAVQTRPVVGLTMLTGESPDSAAVLDQAAAEMFWAKRRGANTRLLYSRYKLLAASRIEIAPASSDDWKLFCRHRPGFLTPFVCA